ncbi:MAG: hypothetical protein AMXMBFR64_55420 [Myxococcales bacterium]
MTSRARRATHPPPAPEAVDPLRRRLPQALHMTTAYHARTHALELRRRGVSEELEALGSALFDARVDLNPHQIEAALFGLRATAERRRLLADEVGLGKTIEAALVLCQRWAECRRLLDEGPMPDATWEERIGTVIAVRGCIGIVIAVRGRIGTVIAVLGARGGYRGSGLRGSGGRRRVGGGAAVRSDHRAVCATGSGGL